MSDLNIVLERNAASLEFDAAGLRSIGENLVKNLSLYVRNMSIFLNNKLSGLKGEFVGFTQNTTVSKYVEKTNYINLAEVALPIPTGLNTDMLEYLEALEANQSIVDKIMTESFDPAYKWFSLLLASPENLSSVDPLNAAKINLFKEPIEKAKQGIANCFIKNDRVEYMRYGDLYKRNADYVKTQHEMAELSDRMAKNSPASIRKKVEQICEVLDRLALRIKQDPNVYATNGIKANLISEVAYSLAVIGEFYASHFFLMQTTIAVMTDTNDRLSKIL